MRHLSTSVQGLGVAPGQNLAPIDTCEICLKGKFTAHPNHSAASTKYTVFFSHISTDLCGPMPVISYDGYRYFIAFICSATKWLEIRLLTSKAGALKAFRDVKSLVENQSGDSIKIVRSDWGREFENHEFTEYLATNGIAHEHSAPYSHEQNGQSERLNRTILDKARCLLFQAQMSKEYWSEAVLVAAYLYNCTPHSAIDYTTRKSTTGYLFLFGNSAVSWSSKLQKTVALSSCEAEYMALKEGIKEQIWLECLYRQLDIPRQDERTTLYTDSQSAIELAKNPEHHARTKHIDIQYHFVRQNVQNATVNLTYIPTNDQPADGLTKALDATKFGNFVKYLGLSTETIQ